MSNTVRMRYVLNDSFLQFLKSKLTLAWSNSCLHCKLDNCSLSKYIYSFLLNQCFHNVSPVMYSFKCVLGSKVGFVIVQKKSLQKLNSSGQEKWMWTVQNSTISRWHSQTGAAKWAAATRRKQERLSAVVLERAVSASARIAEPHFVLLESALEPRQIGLDVDAGSV